MDREITTGTYWFYRGRFDRAGMDMEIVLDKPVDGDVLQAAAEKTLRRFPFLRFTCRRSEDDTRYLLRENTRPFSAVSSPGFVSFDDSRAAGFLWTLGYSENQVYLRLFHGLSDGLGLAAVAKILLCFYLSGLTGDPIPPDLAELAEAEPDGREYADPFAFARPCEQQYSFRVPEAFLLEGESADTYAPYHRRVTLSLRQVLTVSKQSEGSVSGILSLLLARALDRWKDGASKCLVVKCPINLRPMLGCAETLQNCVSSVKYVYSEKLKKMPLPQQASCFMGMLMIQSAEEFQMNSFWEWKEEVRSFNRESSIEEKRAMMEVPRDSYPLVSYLGSFSVGDFDRHICSVGVTIGLGGGVGILAVSLGDGLVLSLLSSEKNRSFVQSMTEELDALGIPYTVE